MAHAEEHVLFVLSGTGELRSGGASAMLRADTVAYLGPRESHSVTNTGRETLRMLQVTPLLVRSERALGLGGGDRQESKPQPEPMVEDQKPARMVREAAPEPQTPVVPQVATVSDEEKPLPDISSLMKRGSDIAAGPRPERKRPAPAPEPEPEPEPEPQP